MNIGKKQKELLKREKAETDKFFKFLLKYDTFKKDLEFLNDKYGKDGDAETIKKVINEGFESSLESREWDKKDFMEEEWIYLRDQLLNLTKFYKKII